MEKFEEHEVVELNAGSAENKHPSKTSAVAILILAILYLVSPLDVIPDFIPVLGWLDDAGVSIYAIRRLIRAFGGDD
nr:hypothetical protein [uncultured bacterium]